MTRVGSVGTLSALVLWIAAAGLVVQGCTSKSEDAENEPQGGVGDVAGGDHIPPFYLEPVPLTEGDYLPEDFPFQEVAERGIKIAGAEADLPLFKGETAGFEVYPSDSQTEIADGERCRVDRFVESKALNMSYLPPGTFARSPQFEGICGDGSVSFVMQSFDTKHANFDLIYLPASRSIVADAPETRVNTLTVKGQPALVIKPLLDEGFGRSYVAIGLGDGVLYVDARDLPLAESTKVIEGVTCEVC